MSSFAEQIERTPVTFVIAFSYVALALLTDPISPTRLQLADLGAATSVMLYDEPWRIVTCAFLHGGILHLLLNLHCLVVIGPIVEATLGKTKFVILYLVGAIGCTIAAMLWNQHGSIVGGSGALFAMFGAIVAINMRSGRHYLDAFQFRGPRSIVVMIALNFAICFFIPIVSNSGHLGGMIAGFVVTFLFLDRGREVTPDTIARWNQLAWIALFVSLIAYTMAPIGHAWYARATRAAEAPRQVIEAEIEAANDPVEKAWYRWCLRLWERR